MARTRPTLAAVGPAVILLAGVVGLTGCVEERVVHDGWGWLRDSEWSDPPSGSAAAGNASAPGDRDSGASSESGSPANPQRGGWAIQVAQFDGRDRQRNAKRLAKLVQQHSRMAEIWLDDLPATSMRPAKVRVMAGHYRSSDDIGAWEDLNHLRLIELGSDFPFAGAELIALGSAVGGDGSHASEWDLKGYVGMYTLQIGFFDDNAGPQFRQLCEQAVKILRDKGEPAYYYHGPHRSLLCLGLFTEGDFVEQGGLRSYGPRIRELQTRYPHNLANGYTQVEKQNGQTIGEQPSFLVRVF